LDISGVGNRGFNRDATAEFKQTYSTKVGPPRSLGGVESLISLPALMTHASTPRETRLALGVTDRLVRISVGIEDSDDLIADLKAALG
jgi:cystathionine beta-lyase/cystathionine gamma-synthase